MLFLEVYLQYQDLAKHNKTYMLKEIYIESYKSLKNVTVQFKDGLNIIIGKNGSGKSNLLEFIDSFHSTLPFTSFSEARKKYNDYNFKLILSQKDENGQLDCSIEAQRKTILDLKSKEVSYDTYVTISKRRLDSETPFYRREYNYQRANSIKGNTQYKDVIRELRSFLNVLYPKVFLQFNIPPELGWLDKPSSFEIDDGLIVDSYGVETNSIQYNLSVFSLFDNFLTIAIREKGIDYYSNSFIEDFKSLLPVSFEKYLNSLTISHNLRSFTPIQDLRVSRNVNIYKINDNILVENLTLEFKVDDTWVPWSYLSDGTKRLFYLVAEMCCQEDGLILIEEPELGIHPHQLYKLMQFIKEQSEEKQIIISTHSPLILDTLEGNE